MNTCKAEDAEPETTEAVDFVEDVTESICDFNEEFIDGKCIDSCISKKACGNFTTCSSSGFSTYCSCIKGYTGNPLKACFKMDEKSPCDPNPCGPKAVCIPEDDKIGPHCKCSEGFYDWPPYCRAGCANDSQCGPTEFCNQKNYCEELCDSTRCGENSVCRLNKSKRTIHCSCKDGFIPEKNIGCRPKLANDTEILIDFLDDVLTDDCDGKCGYNAHCGSEKKCVCTQGYTGDPHKECELSTTDRTDPCNPNPCGGYSTCEIVNNEAKCSCIEGYGDPPYCSKCYSATGCTPGNICSDNRCVPNVCEHYCGNNVACNIFKGKFECLCPIQAVNENSKPFEDCPEVHFISAALIATLSG